MAKTLSKTQIAYIIERLSEHKKCELEKLADTLPYLEDVSDTAAYAATNPYELSFEAKVAAIRDGSAVLLNGAGEFDCIDDCFKFPISAEAAAWEKEASAQADTYCARIKDIDAACESLVDKLYLSPADEALAAFAAFLKLPA